MADPISTASGIVALVVFAFQSSKCLYEVVSSFQSNQRTVRELREELQALNEVLQSLQVTATDTNADLASLRRPLIRCGKACKDFEEVIDRCTQHSGGPRTSFRDWAKLKYMGDDITGFKNMLAGYKSTIIIALGDANIRTSTVSANFLQEFKEVISNTTSDLNEHLQAIDIKLRSLSLQGPRISDEDAVQRKQIQEERDSTEQCLNICTQVCTHLANLQVSKVVEDVSTPLDSYWAHVGTSSSHVSARLLTAESLKVCTKTMVDSSSRLKAHLQNLDNRLASLPARSPQISSEQAAEQESIQEEIDSIKQCLVICAEASIQAGQDRINVFEDVSMADDGRQVIVSTIGDLISAKRITAGARSMQLMGQMSDESLQQFSQTRHHVTEETEPKTGSGFEERHGAGWKLTSRNL